MVEITALKTGMKVKDKAFGIIWNVVLVENKEAVISAKGNTEKITSENKEFFDVVEDAVPASATDAKKEYVVKKGFVCVKGEDVPAFEHGELRFAAVLHYDEAYQKLILSKKHENNRQYYIVSYDIKKDLFETYPYPLTGVGVQFLELNAKTALLWKMDTGSYCDFKRAFLFLYDRENGRIALQQDYPGQKPIWKLFPMHIPAWGECIVNIANTRIGAFTSPDAFLDVLHVNEEDGVICKFDDVHLGGSPASYSVIPFGQHYLVKGEKVIKDRENKLTFNISDEIYKKLVGYDEIVSVENTDTCYTAIFKNADGKYRKFLCLYTEDRGNVMKVEDLEC